MSKQDIYDQVQGLEGLCRDIARNLWAHPEQSGQEQESANYLRSIMTKEGFSLENSRSLEHAFVASYGHGKPVLAVLCEYDALPNLSQRVCPEKSPVGEGQPGHGCGHNLLGSAAVTTAIAIKRYIQQTGVSGTVRLYGCPQEELLDGKVRMIAEGMFKGCDAALTWHPMDANIVHDKAYLANTSLKFFFTGKTSHAAFAPERGRSALDAVELTSVGVNYLREHVVDKTRIHYTTDSGGFAPNIVPDKASAWYFVRAPHMADVKDTAERVIKVAQGAAMMTETTVRVQRGYGCCEFQENTAFSDLTYRNLLEAPAPVYTPKERSLAAQLQATVDPNIVIRSKRLYDQPDAAIFQGAGARELWKDCQMTASSDTGDVSFIMPANLLTTACFPLGVSPHTWQATASGGSGIGEKGALYAAYVLSGTAYDLLNDPAELEKIKEEFNARDTGTYRPLVGEE